MCRLQFKLTLFHVKFSVAAWVTDELVQIIHYSWLKQIFTFFVLGNYSSVIVTFKNPRKLLKRNNTLYLKGNSFFCVTHRSGGVFSVHGTSNSWEDSDDSSSNKHHIEYAAVSSLTIETTYNENHKQCFFFLHGCFRAMIVA